MPRLPVVSGHETLSALKHAGFEEVRQRGDHVFVIHVTERHRRTTVPLHRELDRGTLRAILRQAGLTVDQFVALLND